MIPHSIQVKCLIGSTIFEYAFLKFQNLMYDLLNSDIEDTRCLKLSIETMISSLMALKVYDELRSNLERLNSFYSFVLGNLNKFQG